MTRIVGDTEQLWAALFNEMGAPAYPEPIVVLFSGRTQSACGMMTAAVGPRYCPDDRKIYVDPAFLEDVHGRAGARSDFAVAYLLVHEISHHVQNALGTTGRLEQGSQSTASPLRQRQLRLEWQADCYTGVWVHSAQARNLLEPREVEDGLPAALALGDASTHGAIDQRVSWFNRGIASGDPAQCNAVS